MSSRRIEDKHVSMLKDLISGTGLLECVRPLEEYSLEEEVEADPEEITFDEAEQNEEQGLLEAESVEVTSEICLEEEPDIFPTPSLRHLLPDSTRDIEKYNRIEVLPPEFHKDIDITKIPIIATTPPQTYIEILGEIVGCDTYTYNLAEFWFLDTLANLLRRGQEDGMSKGGQALLILWFCEWMQEMQNFDAASRERMIKRFKRNMLAAAKFIGSEDRIPMPDEIGVNHLTNKIATPRTSENEMLRRLVEVTMMEGGTPYECSLRDLVQIIHFIFDLFSTDYQYELVRSVFTFTPDYQRIDCPYQIQTPKRLHGPLPKPKPKKEQKKDIKEKKDAKKDKKGAAAAKTKESPPTADYLRLMDLMARDKQELADLDEKDREDWHRKNSILPLQQAADEEFFAKYWPPPPPQPVVVEVAKSDKKKGGKKK